MAFGSRARFAGAETNALLIPVADGVSKHELEGLVATVC